MAKINTKIIINVDPKFEKSLEYIKNLTNETANNLNSLINQLDVLIDRLEIIKESRKILTIKDDYLKKGVDAIGNDGCQLNTKEL